MITVCQLNELQTYDYVLSNNGSSSTRVSTHLKIRWMDPPGLYPGDIRSRHMMLEVDKNDMIPAHHHQKLVWRSTYRCSGSCQRQSMPHQAKTLKTSEEQLKDWTRAVRERNICTPTPPSKELSRHSCKAVLIVSA